MTHRAYGYARVSAQRSTLLTHDDIAALRLTTDAVSSGRLAAAAGLDTEAKRFSRLLGRYRTVLVSYPDARPLVRAILGLHEIENVKLGWRAVTRSIPPDRWTSLWRDLQDLASVSIEAFTSAHTLHGVVERLEKTPFGVIARSVLSSHGEDLGAAELAFDRFASMEVVREAAALPRSERLARQLAEAIVRQRDDEIERRGVTAYGLSAEAAAAARVLRRTKRAPDIAALCRSAFRGEAMRLSPAIAWVILVERDDRTARALVERAGDASLDEATDGVIASSGRTQ